MARTLKEFPISPKARYPWDQWLDGQVWQLEERDDYGCKTTTLRQNAKVQATKRGGRVKSCVNKEPDGDILYLQFLEDAG